MQEVVVQTEELSCDRVSKGSALRENARVQSFPDWFRFLSSKTNQMSLVGNSVPPKLAFNIAKTLSKVLNILCIHLCIQ